MIHRTYRLRELVQALGGCWRGCEIVCRFQTVEDLVAWINQDPGNWEYDGLHGTRAGLVVWLRQALNAELGLPTLRGFTPGEIHASAPGLYGSPFDRALQRTLPLSTEEVEELKRDAMCVMDRRGLYRDRTYNLRLLLEHGNACPDWISFATRFQNEDDLLKAITPELRIPDTSLSLAYDNLRWFAENLAQSLYLPDEEFWWHDRRHLDWNTPGGVFLDEEDVARFKALWRRYADRFGLYSEG